MDHPRQLLLAAAACVAVIALAPAVFAQAPADEATGTPTGTGTGGGTGTGTDGGTGTGGTGTPTGDGNANAGADEAAEMAVELAAIYLPTPAEKAADVTRAVSGLSGRMDRANYTGDVAIQLNCWVHKLEGGNADDRVIQWTRICPNLQTGPARPSSVCEPPMTVPEESLYQQVKTAAEVEPANNQLHFIAHVKSEVLDLQTSFPGNERDQFVVDQMLHLIRDVNKANQELDAMAASTEHGGIPRHYRAMREWITRKRGEANSLYSPCN